MPRHGLVWWWSETELKSAVLTLAATPRLIHTDSNQRYGEPVEAPAGTFTTWHMARAAEAIAGSQWRGQGHALRQALLAHGLIVVVDRRNPRRFLYRVRESDGEQAQRPPSHPDRDEAAAGLDNSPRREP